MNLPRFRGGGAISNALNAMAEAIEKRASSRFDVGYGLTMDTEEEGNTTLSVDRSVLGGRSTPEIHPWKPKQIGGGKVRINIGSVGGTVLPENWNSDIEITQTTDAGAMWLEVDINEDGRATAARYHNSETAPLVTAPSGYDQLPPKIYYFLFGYKSKDGKVSRFYIGAKKNLELVVNMSGSVYSATYREAYLRESA